MRKRGNDIRIKSSRNELVGIAFMNFNLMGKVASQLNFTHGSQKSSTKTESETDPKGYRVCSQANGDWNEVEYTEGRNIQPSTQQFQ